MDRYTGVLAFDILDNLHCQIVKNLFGSKKVPQTVFLKVEPVHCPLQGSCFFLTQRNLVEEDEQWSRVARSDRQFPVQPRCKIRPPH